jgi:hypothetical protein
MKTGLEFIQRMQEDAEFRQKVNAHPQGEERLAFVRSEGYDFDPFVQILNNLSSGPRPRKEGSRRGGRAFPGVDAPGFLSRLSQILFTSKSLRPYR